MRPAIIVLMVALAVLVSGCTAPAPPPSSTLYLPTQQELEALGYNVTGMYDDDTDVNKEMASLSERDFTISEGGNEISMSVIVSAFLSEDAAKAHFGNIGVISSSDVIQGPFDEGYALDLGEDGFFGKMRKGNIVMVFLGPGPRERVSGLYSTVAGKVVLQD
jgi:hypothetical protein